MHVDEAIQSRRSVRRFLSTPVAQKVIRHILQIASRAPSGNNIQPWRVHVVTGEVRQALCRDILQAASEAAEQHQAEYAYYPTQWVEPYLGRRRQNGFALYEVLGIGRDDRQRREQQMLRNYSFFDAPVGLLVTLDRCLNTGSYMDVGMFIENILVAARAQGLHTCAQAAFATFHAIVREHLPLNEDDILVCGIALGHEDTQAPENRLLTERQPVEAFASFHGFSETPETERVC
ncbi:Nitroreductase [Azotobacter beijerinckii]|uniref:Nitroreductase n=1 Tax=Azotobacter beijerinckii TaxID=170623 RepID=A0A1H6RTQ7_9GAMM|nr:nitroreductase [Azotobacter beijerinckii]SEI54915.1 Nitroreductase [Azotobacter beijerinckii]